MSTKQCDQCAGHGEVSWTHPSGTYGSWVPCKKCGGIGVVEDGLTIRQIAVELFIVAAVCYVLIKVCF